MPDSDTSPVRPPPLSGGSAGDDVHRLDHGKVLPNLVAAGIMLLLAAWLFFSDLAVAGDMLFHGSLALPVLGLYVGLFSLAGHVLAVVPVRFLVGANLVLLFRAGFGYPLNCLLSNTPASIFASLVVVAFAAWYFVSTVRGGCGIVLRPWFRWRHLLVTGVILLGLLVASVPWLVGGNIRALQNLFGDYIRIGPRGISLVERVFEKDGHSVHLIGMMHIGDAKYYEELKARIAERPAGTRVVLQEGVRDREGLLPDSFVSGRLYHGIARTLGLEMQGRLDAGAPAVNEREEAERTAAWQALGVHFHDADMDISDLDEKHRRLLVEMLEMLGASSLEELLLASTRFRMTAAELEDLIMNGLIGARNEVLIGHLEEVGLRHDEVYIPWGAAHLGDVERRIREAGYVEVAEISRRVVEFW